MNWDRSTWAVSNPFKWPRILHRLGTKWIKPYLPTVLGLANLGSLRGSSHCLPADFFPRYQVTWRWVFVCWDAPWEPWNKHFKMGLEWIRHIYIYIYNYIYIYTHALYTWHMHVETVDMYVYIYIYSKQMRSWKDCLAFGPIIIRNFSIIRILFGWIKIDLGSTVFHGLP